MDNWLKGLGAIASAMIIIAFSIWTYDRYQAHLIEQERATTVMLRTKFNSCLEIVKQATISNVTLEQAITCSREHPELAGFEKQIEEMARKREASVNRKAALADLQNAYLSKENTAQKSDDKVCFTTTRNAFETNGKDVLYILPPSDPKIKVIRDCIRHGVFSEEEMNAALIQNYE